MHPIPVLWCVSTLHLKHLSQCNRKHVGFEYSWCSGYPQMSTKLPANFFGARVWTGIIRIPILGESKNANVLILRDFPLVVHCLDWSYNDPCWNIPRFVSSSFGLSEYRGSFLDGKGFSNVTLKHPGNILDPWTPVYLEFSGCQSLAVAERKILCIRKVLYIQFALDILPPIIYVHMFSFLTYIYI